MSQEHYFSSKPASEDALRTVRVRLAGRDLELLTAAGVFSPEHLDHGTRVLLEHVPVPPADGALLDLGCGWGPMALTLALRSPDATVWAVDVNERALDLVRRNAARLGLTNVNAVLPGDVPGELEFRAIWSNPPIRIGKQALHELLETWLPRLEAERSAWLVVQKNLGADSLQRWLGETLAAGTTIERRATDKGFRLIEVRSPSA
ncbi:methyltransferase [Agromyces mediolanus]|uniref:class I SAM-dependent methyltransferase n=1 Tax=Agromyces mediolanus TaxID=41986 RepID=UPI0038337015